MTPERYRKKPVEVEAMQLTKDNRKAVARWCGGMVLWRQADRAHVVLIETLEGRVYASPGDYVIRGVEGEFYPCKPDIFEQTYEEVEA